MTREEKFNETIKHFTKEDQDIIKKDSAVGLSFLILQDFYEAQLKAKDEEIKELGEIVQQYLIPSKNYDAIIRDKDEEIVKLKLELFRSSPKIANKKTRSIVAMLFWEYKKLRYTSDGYFHSDEEIENAYYTFKKAYKMLKDNK